MSSLTTSQGTIRFGDFQVDFRSGELRKHGILIKLQVQPFQVLQILLEQPGEVVGREKLQKRIWQADTFVDFDHGLNNAVKKLREALGDNAEKPRFIETLSKRGYRFIGTIQNGSPIGRREATTLETPEETTAREPHRRGFLWGLVLGGVVVAAIVLVVVSKSGGLRDRLLGRSTATRIQSLAVLPLENLSNDPSQEYFSDGMTDALITDLAQIGSLKVISRTSSMQYKQTKKSLPEIARELNVDGIVEGTVQRSGDRVRITAQLIQGSTDKHLWANSYERNLSDVLALERDVTQEIARAIQAQVRTPSPEPTAQPRTVSVNVLEAYLQGNYLLNREGRGGGGDENSTKAAEYFQQAIDADPNFAPAYLGKAEAYGSFYLQSSENLAITRKAVQKAIDLDPTLPDAWVELGDIHCLHDWDWPSAEKEYRRAIALNPNSVQGHKELGDFLSMMGRLDEALKEYQIAQERDPTQDYLSLIIYLRGDRDHAIELLKQQIERHPDEGWDHLTLHRWLAVKGMYKESVQELEKGLTLFGFPEIAARIHHAFASSGYEAALREAAKQLEQLQEREKIFFPMTIAQLYAGIRDKDRAFYWLEQAYEHRDRIGGDFGLELVRLEPMLDPLRSDPRFEDLMRRVGLPP